METLLKALDAATELARTSTALEEFGAQHEVLEALRRASITVILAEDQAEKKALDGGRENSKN